MDSCGIAAFLLWVLVAQTPFAVGQQWHKTKRLQVALGHDSNIFEQTYTRSSDAYLRLQLNNQLNLKNKSKFGFLTFDGLGTIYANVPRENKIHLILSGGTHWLIPGKNDIGLTGKIQIKRFINTPAGFWVKQGGIHFQNKQGATWQFLGEFLVEDWRFFQISQFNFYAFRWNLQIKKFWSPRFHQWLSTSVDFTKYPKRLSNHLEQNIRAQRDWSEALEVGVSWIDRHLLSGSVRMLRNQSNFPGLSYNQFDVQLASVVRISSTVYIRGLWRSMLKRYVKSAVVLNQIRLDPELGEGSSLNMDFVIINGRSTSYILRFRRLLLESIIRNSYYKKFLLELLIERQ